MKKSVFLEKLYAKTDEFTAKNSEYNLVDFIIEEAIKMGMKPPERKERIQKFCDNHDGEYYAPVHKWDEE